MKAKAPAHQVDLDSVVTADAAIAAWLKPIRLAEDLNDAISIAAQLSDTESVITRDGIWLADIGFG